MLSSVESTGPDATEATSKGKYQKSRHGQMLFLSCATHGSDNRFAYLNAKLVVVSEGSDEKKKPGSGGTHL